VDVGTICASMQNGIVSSGGDSEMAGIGNKVCARASVRVWGWWWRGGSIYGNTAKEGNGDACLLWSMGRMSAYRPPRRPPAHAPASSGTRTREYARCTPHCAHRTRASHQELRWAIVRLTCLSLAPCCFCSCRFLRLTCAHEAWQQEVAVSPQHAA
jgi:hypothetical protein